MYAATSPSLSPFNVSDEGGLRFQDPTNPATFSQVHAELERPLQPGGRVQSSIGYGDPYHPSLAQPSSNTSIYRYGGAPEAH